MSKVVEDVSDGSMPSEQVGIFVTGIGLPAVLYSTRHPKNRQYCSRLRSSDPDDLPDMLKSGAFQAAQADS